MQNDNTQAFNLETLLEKIDRIVIENDYIRDAMKAFGAAEDVENLVEMASALASIVEVRERTNRDIIALYSKMYEDMRKPSTDSRMQYLPQVAECYGNAKDEAIPFLQETVERMLGVRDDED